MQDIFITAFTNESATAKTNKQTKINRKKRDGRLENPSEKLKDKKTLAASAVNQSSFCSPCGIRSKEGCNQCYHPSPG